MNQRTVRDALRAAVEASPDQPAYRYKRDGRWLDLTWKEAAGLLDRVSRSLIALGVGHGQTACILSQTRLEWVLVDVGLNSMGSVTVGIYHSNLGADCAYIFNHCEAELLFVENQEQLDKILEVRSDLPKLKRIVRFEGPAVPEADVLSWDEFLALGEAVDEATLTERRDAVQPEDLLSLVYTSGTTGTPKGVMLTQRNLLFAGWSSGQRTRPWAGAVTLLFLPLAHVYARVVVYQAMLYRVTIAFAEGLNSVPANLLEVRPHSFAGVPRVFEKFHEKILAAVRSAGGLKQMLFERGVALGLRVVRLRQEGKPVPALLSLRYALLDRLVLHRVRSLFGGRLEHAIAGAAPMNREIAEFFGACGVLVLEGIGMTENSSFSNVNAVEDNRYGTVGKPGPGIEVKIAEDGEVLFRGENIMKGYFKDPQATAETLTEDGWLHSGDVGEIDPDGRLIITDRKKDLIVTAGGKNVAPQRIERILRTSRYISHVMAYGDRRKFITAVITLDPESIREWAVQKGLGTSDLEKLAAHPRVHELIEREVRERNGQLASFESVKRFHLVGKDFSIEDGDLTPTLKIRRKNVVEKHRAAIEALYVNGENAEGAGKN